MADDSTVTPDAGTDPTQDTQASATGDTTGNTGPAPQPVDWKARYENLQTDHTRQAQRAADAERRAAELEAQFSADDGDDSDDGDGGEPAPQATRRTRDSIELQQERERREAAEWQLAQTVHGPEVASAYETAADLLDRATTYADAMTAFEAYHQLRSGGQAPAAAATQAAQPGNLPPPAAVQPRVDQNRPDGPANSNEVEEARSRGDLAGWVGALRRSLEAKPPG